MTRRRGSGRIVAALGVIVAVSLGQMALGGAQETEGSDPAPDDPSTVTTTTLPPEPPPPFEETPDSSTTTTSSTSPTSSTTTTTEPQLTAAAVPGTANEAPDFASRAWSDPWDMSNREDMLINPPWTALNVLNGKITNGVMIFALDGVCGTASCSGFVTPLWPGIVPGALPMGRDGVLGPNTINANTYKYLSIRLYATGLRSAGIFWSRGGSANDPNKQGGMPASFIGDGQWRTYTFKLQRYAPFNRPIDWSGLINGLRIVLNPPQGQRPIVMIDWIRLYEEDPAGTITGVEPSSPLYYSGVGGPGCEQITGSQNANVSALPPGTYTFYRTPNCADAPIGPVNVVPRPLPTIKAPSLEGGADYATTYLRDPWDMNGPPDVKSWANTCGASYTKVPGAFSGYNCLTPYTGHIDDPLIELRVGSGKLAIPSHKFHRLTLEFTYSGPFSLYGGCHGGTIGRVMWLTTMHSGPVRQTQDIITWKDRTKFTVDLDMHKLLLNDGPASTWTPFVVPPGHYVTYLRFDPNEDTCARYFHLHDVKLRMDDRPTLGVFKITWNDPRAMPGDRVYIFVKPVSGGSWTLLNPSGSLNSATDTSYAWNTTGVAKGKYNVLMRVARSDLSNYTDVVAGGPVEIV